MVIWPTTYPLIPSKLPFKNSNPLCAGPTVGANCRGIVTTDVLEQGLSRRAITLGSLKGLIGTKDTRGFYTSSAPYDEGKSLRLVGISIARVSITKMLNSPAWLSTCCFLALSRCRVVPLYIEVDALRPTESRPTHNRVWLGDFFYMPFFTSLSLHMAVHNIRPSTAFRP